LNAQIAERTTIFGRIQTGFHAGKDRESAHRRQRQITFGYA
jgi:hypothetical protein